MASLEDLEARVIALEEKVQHVREDAAAARVLAGAADRDVAEFKQTLKAHTTVLNALRETQVEHGQILAVHGQRLDSIESKVEALDSKVEVLDAKVDSGFTKVNIAVGQIATLLQRVIDKD